MKVNEVIDPSLEEGWKERLGALGIAGALGLGGAAYNNQKPADQDSRVSTGTVQSSPAKAPQVAAPKIDLNKLAAALPGPAQLLKNHAMQAGIKGEELVQFLAQSAHETLNFTRTEETGSPNYFKKYEPVYKKDQKTKKIIVDPATKKPKNFNPTAKMLGNVKPGDGETYKGRGFLQITGRWNYKAAGKALGLPLEQHPELLNKPEVAAKVSIWYWNTFVKPNIDNFKDVKSVTKEINPGLNGLQDRNKKYQNFMQIAMK